MLDYKRQVKVYDAGSQYADRYVVVFPEGYVRTMSSNAMAPNGCNIYHGDWILYDEDEIEVEFDDLPEQVIQAIRIELDALEDETS